jgi:hypothetical protein
VYRNIREIPRPAGEASGLRNAQLNNQDRQLKNRTVTLAEEVTLRFLLALK